MGHMSWSCLITYFLSIHTNAWNGIGVGILLWDSSPWLLSRLTFQTFCSIIGSTWEDISSTSSAPTSPSTFSSELNQKLIAAFQTFWAVISWNPPKDHLPHSVPAPAAHQHDNFPQSIQWPTFSSSCCNQRQIQKTHTFFHYHEPKYNACTFFKSFYWYHPQPDHHQPSSILVTITTMIIITNLFHHHHDFHQLHDSHHHNDCHHHQQDDEAHPCLTLSREDWEQMVGKARKWRCS